MIFKKEEGRVLYAVKKKSGRFAKARVRGREEITKEHTQSLYPLNERKRKGQLF